MTLTSEMALRLVSYNTATGILTWNKRTSDQFKPHKQASAEAQAEVFNKRFAGKPAGGPTGWGYITLRLYGRHYRAHNIIWLITHGKSPDGEIDHIDHDRANNRLENLRDVSRTENTMNRKIGTSNKSGYMGVNRDGLRSIWRAEIHVNKKRIFLGRFADIKDAVAARKAAEVKYGFHPNHGNDRVKPLAQKGAE